MLSDTDEDHYYPSIRLIEIEKNNIQCGFHLTRSKWDPYPWVSSVDKNSAASSAGLRTGDCVLEVNGEDILGKRISEIAEIVKSKSEQVSLLLWNAGIDAQCTPETLCCGPLPKHLQKLASCVSAILAFIECPVCLETIPRPSYQCDNGHLICRKCRCKTERCPVCRIRLHRGRSLMADHVFTTIADTFASSQETEETRLAKIHKMFKQKPKKRNIPDIKITESCTNKLISKITGKSSSVDNLATSKYLSANNTDEEHSLHLTTKSHSANEIFNHALSRNASCSGIRKHHLNVDRNKHFEERPASFHGSFEFLERRTDSTSPIYGSFNSIETVPTDNCPTVSYYCPFSTKCTMLLKGNGMFEHFVKEHSSNQPLIQYFVPNLELFLKDFRDNQEYCYTILSYGQTFFLKIKLQNEGFNNASDILLWVWYVGCAMGSRNYGVQIEIKNVLTKDVLLGVRSSVFSLNSESAQDIKASKKGVYLNAKSIEALGFASNELLLETTIFENDI